MKTCRICSIEKNDGDFNYPTKSNTGTCKACSQQRAKTRIERLQKDPEWLEKEKSRQREKANKFYKNGNRPTKKMKKIGIDNYRANYPEKYRAITLSQRMICPKGYHKHHWSYAEEHAKDVVIVTKEAHYYFHRHHTYDQERMAYRDNAGKLMDKADTVAFILEWNPEAVLPKPF